jgi:iron complex transport system ATP-binding protein
MIKLEHVSMHRDGVAILDDVSWRVPDGAHTVLLGPNGSGKTALLQVVTGYMPPSSGEVEVLGFRRGGCDLRNVRRRIGWVSTALGERMHSPDSALDVVVSGKYASIGLWDTPEASDYEAARRELARMGCEALAQRRYAVLSQGEKQRVLIARALVAGPSLLILDEPCSGLDLAAREQLLRYIEKLGAVTDGPTLVYVTHHIDEITPIFSRVTVMKNGRLRAEGPPQEVITSELLSSTYEMPLEVRSDGARLWAQPAGVRENAF